MEKQSQCRYGQQHDNNGTNIVVHHPILRVGSTNEKGREQWDTIKAAAFNCTSCCAGDDLAWITQLPIWKNQPHIDPPLKTTGVAILVTHYWNPTLVQLPWGYLTPAWPSTAFAHFWGDIHCTCFFERNPVWFVCRPSHTLYLVWSLANWEEPSMVYL